MDWFDQNPLPPINLITTAPLSDVVRELPILSLQNPGTESLLESMFADHTSMLLNCRDINLAQQLCQTLSQVNTQSLTFRHSSDSITTLPPLLQTCLQINPNTFNGSTSLQIPSGIAPPLQFSSQFQPTNQSFSYSPTGFAAPHQQISPTACAYTTSSSYPHSFLPLQDNPLTNNHNFLPSYAQVPTSQSVSSSLSNNIRPTIRPTAVVPPIQKEQQHIPKEKTISPNAPSSSSLSSTSISPNKQELIFTEKFRSSPPPPLFSHDQHQHQQQRMAENDTKSSEKQIEMNVQQPRIILQKLEINEKLDESKPLRRTTTITTKQTGATMPSQNLDLPSDFTPDLIKELLQDGCSLNGLAGSSAVRQRRAAAPLSSSSRTPLSKRRYINDDEEEDDADERSQSPIGNDGNYQQPKKRIRRKELDNPSLTNINTTKHQQPPQVAKDIEKQRIKEEREREKIERLEKLGRKAMDIEDDPLENTAFQRFVELLDNFIDDYDRYEERLDDSIKISQSSQSDTEDENSMLDVLLSESTLDELATLSEKLKLSTYMNRIEKTKLKRLLKIISFRIKQGIKLHPVLNHNKQQQDEKKAQDENFDDEEEERLWRDIIIERLLLSANACEVALNIMTTLNMSKEVFIEHVIENLALFVKSQLTKTIFPEYDPVYRNDLQSKDPLLAKQKRSKVSGSRCKMVQLLYNKIVSLFQGLIDLVQLSRYPDTIILSISSFTVSCIFVENIMDLQQHSISILTQIFARYDKHRDSILDDLLLSLVRLPTSKKSIRCYYLNSGESIQMFTALIMHLIHSPVSSVKSFVQMTTASLTIPPKQSSSSLKLVTQQADEITEEIRLLNTYTLAQNLAFKFLTAFFRTCGMKQGEDDYRTIFENFLHDLLITANKPEWPSCEILLSLLSRILMTNFSNKTIAINIRLQSLDYLGSVAAQLRKDTIDPNYLNSKDTLSRLDEIVRKTLSSIETDEEIAEDTNDPLRFNKGLVIYLNELSQSDRTSHFAKMFYIGQWLRDLTLTTEKLTQSLTKSKSKQSTTNDNKEEDVNNDDDIENEHVKTKTLSVEEEIEIKQIEKQAILKLLALPSTIGLISFQKQHIHLDIDYDDACLLIRYLTLNRPFLRTFDVYLKQIANIFQSEAGTNIRSKAMKCLCTVVEADPTILSRNDIKSCVQVGLTDKSISVREAAIDLIGRYIVGREQLVLQYYDILCERSLDTGVSVRKRVVKIFRDICLHQPSFIKIPDICSRLLRRIQDEESIRKLVLETFQLLWFTPSRSKSDIRTRVQIIIDVILDFKKQNYQWLENLLKEFLHTNVTTTANDLDRKRINEQRKDVLKSIHEIIDELIEYVLKMESLTVTNDNDQGASDKMVSTFIALYALGKAKPEYLIQHVSTIVDYLNIKCTTHNDNTIVQYVAKILEFTVPLMKSASETLIFKLEESLTKLCLVSGQMVIFSSIACLCAVINRLSKNFQLIKDCFKKYYAYATDRQTYLNNSPDMELTTQESAHLSRSLYILGVLCKYFDIDSLDFEDFDLFTVDDLFQLFIYYINHDCNQIKHKSLIGLGYYLQRYGQYLLQDTVRHLYTSYLIDENQLKIIRCQILTNLEDYFRDCIRRISEEDIEHTKKRRQNSDGQQQNGTTTKDNDDMDNDNDEDSNQKKQRKKSGGGGGGGGGANEDYSNLKDTSDIHSEMASSIAQCYLRTILDTYLTPITAIRQCVRKVVNCILEQGLVHPVQFIPNLIAMTTDNDLTVQQNAEQNLQELDKTHPGIIQTKVMQGLKMSYQLQTLLISSVSTTNIIRGMAVIPNQQQQQQQQQQTQQQYWSCNHFLYSLIRTNRTYRRGLLTQLLKMFDDTTTSSLEEQLFVADNLAYFPYQVQDEPLFIIQTIDLSVSVNGAGILQQFREILKRQITSSEIEEDDDEDVMLMEKVLSYSNAVISELYTCIRSSKSCLLLLLLKQYLKDVYGVNDTKVSEYDQTEAQKVTDRPLTTRKVHLKFHPKYIINYINEQLQTVRVTFSDDDKKQLVKDFQDFKAYLLAFDIETPANPVADDDESSNMSDEIKPITKQTSATTQHQLILQPTSSTSSKKKKQSKKKSKMKKRSTSSNKGDESDDADKDNFV